MLLLLLLFSLASSLLGGFGAAAAAVATEPTVSAAAAVGRALPHRVKRSQPDVGDVAVIVVVADCGPVAGARSPPVYIVNI